LETLLLHYFVKGAVSVVFVHVVAVCPQQFRLLVLLSLPPFTLYQSGPFRPGHLGGSCRCWGGRWGQQTCHGTQGR
jgi:hypothetical protein